VFGSWCDYNEPLRSVVVPPSIARSSPQVVFLVSSKILPVFLVSSKSCLFSWFRRNLAFSWFLQTSSVFLVSLKPRPTNVVVTRWFSSDLSVCSFPYRSLRPHSFLSSYWFACRRDPSPSFSLSRSQFADFSFIIMALFNLFCPFCNHIFFVCPRGGSVTG
jgi:hypothetical protein